MSELKNNDRDQLLSVISAKRDMSWKSFKDTFDYFYHREEKSGDREENQNIKKLKDLRFKTVRGLESLAHCDYNFNKKRLYIASPALVRIPCMGFPQAILTGSRSPQTISELSKICKSVGSHINVEVTEQPIDIMLAPRRVTVRAEAIEELHEIASKSQIPFLENPVAWSLLHFSASVDPYWETLQWQEETELNWDKKTFDPISLKFRSYSVTKQNIHLSQYTNPRTQAKAHYLWHTDKSREIENPDWGRYAILWKSDRQILAYDRRRFTLAVPVGAKLPILLERALTLCSGYLPKFVDKIPQIDSKIFGFHIFSAIPPNIAEILAQKLGQTLNEISLKH
ncbi:MULTISPECIES: hypothetical protein [Spirulina sp. CCY15215]|uniref:hypothetical protein n=1 Tax=Spirulina sp. CCY15215 TaxID=2767591 RepID=UPI00194E79E5|nr:hypothetical protein [Spirulina major]